MMRQQRIQSAVFLGESPHSLDIEKGVANSGSSPNSAAARLSREVTGNACLRVNGRSICAEMPWQKMGPRLHIDDKSIVTPNTAGHTEVCRGKEHSAATAPLFSNQFGRAGERFS